MKKYLLLVFGSFQLVLAAQDLQVMTFNIRLNIAVDSLNAWPYRKDKVASQVLFHDVHLLGVQEAQHDQMVDLKARLPKFKYVGGGRDDGKEKGEYSAIFTIQQGYSHCSHKPSGFHLHPKFREVKAGTQLLQGS